MWMAAGVVGAAYSLYLTLISVRARRLGVDVIALLALVGAMAVGEYLAAAVIAVMIASGQALESWAAARAHRDLRALLQRAPRVARRYQGGLLETVPVEELRASDRVLVATGELVPADMTVPAPRTSCLRLRLRRSPGSTEAPPVRALLRCIFAVTELKATGHWYYRVHAEAVAVHLPDR